MTDIVDEHVPHLDNVANAGLLKKIIPADSEEYLLKQGYIRKGVGGLIATELGHKVLKEKVG